MLPPLFSPPYPGRAHERLLWPLFVAPEKGADRALTWNRRKSAGGLKTSRRRAKMGLAQRFEMQSHGFGTNGNLNKNDLKFRQSNLSGWASQSTSILGSDPSGCKKCDELFFWEIEEFRGKGLRNPGNK